MSSDDKPTNFIRPLEHQQWRNQTQLAANLALVVFIGIIIGALYLVQTTTTTTTSRTLFQMGDQIDRLQRQNERLRAEIAALQAMPRVMTRAAEMGFHEAAPDEIQWLTVPGYQYRRTEVPPTPTPVPDEEEQVYDETLGGWLRQQWDSLKQQFEDWRSQ